MARAAISSPGGAVGRGSGVFKVGRPEQQPTGDGPEGSENAPVEPANKPTKSSGPNKKVIAIGAVAAAVIIAGGAVALTQSGNGTASAPQAAAPLPTGPMNIESVLPAAGTSQVDGAGPISVSFSDPVASDSPKPTLSPAIPGSWSNNGTTLTFTPTAPIKPSTKVTVDVPAGPGGIRATNGDLLTKGVTETFTTGSYSTVRLAEMLSQLGYMPLSFSPTENGAAKDPDADPANETPQGLAYDPPQGTWTWASGYPYELTSQWNPDQWNVITRGAVMAFESQHGMTINGDVNQKLWTAVFRAYETGQQNQNGYTYALASKHLPETLTIWHNGQIVMHTLANTGIPISPTVDGTFPVYQRYRFQIMSGTNPDGSSYADPVSFVSYFNGGDAVHYFPRGSYGFQQSLGCVELPYNSAEQAYPFLTYGSLVTVAG
jgi:hypothetical protein